MQNITIIKEVMHGTFPSIFKFHNMDTFSMPASVMSIYFVASPWDNSIGQFGFNKQTANVCKMFENHDSFRYEINTISIKCFK